MVKITLSKRSNVFEYNVTWFEERLEIFPEIAAQDRSMRTPLAIRP